MAGCCAHAGYGLATAGRGGEAGGLADVGISALTATGDDASGAEALTAGDGVAGVAGFGPAVASALPGALAGLKAGVGADVEAAVGVGGLGVGGFWGREGGGG